MKGAVGWFQYIHPALWFMDEAMPATHTYHLEHTLFPLINYLYLPRVASIVEEVAVRYGMEPADFVIEGLPALKQKNREWRVSYSKEKL